MRVNGNEFGWYHKKSMRRPAYFSARRWAFALGALTLAFAVKRATVSASSTGPPFVEFESGPVRPLAMSLMEPRSSR